MWLLVGLNFLVLILDRGLRLVFGYLGLEFFYLLFEILDFLVGCQRLFGLNFIVLIFSLSLRLVFDDLGLELLNLFFEVLDLLVFGSIGHLGNLNLLNSIFMLILVVRLYLLRVSLFLFRTSLFPRSFSLDLGVGFFLDLSCLLCILSVALFIT